MRRYCIFSAQFLPHLGGVERYTYNLAKKLIELGDEVTVVTSKAGQWKNYEEMDAIKIYRLPCINFMDGRFPVLKFNKEFRKINRILCRLPFDMVIVNTRFYLHSVYGQWFGKHKGCRTITIDHGSSHLSMHNVVLDFAGNVFEHFITQIGSLFCKEYYGVSDASVDWLKHFHIQAKGKLYNSISLKEIEQMHDESKQHFREKYNIKKEDIVLVYTGRLLKEKGLPALIDATKKIQKNHENVYLLIAGEGPLEDYVQTNGNDHIILLGRISFEEIITLLDESDIFCLPSVSEGFSSSVLEAAACHCYIIMTNTGGVNELLISHEYGTILKDDKVDTIAAAIEVAINDETSRKIGVDLTYKKLETNYTWDVVGEKVHNL